MSRDDFAGRLLERLALEEHLGGAGELAGRATPQDGQAQRGAGQLGGMTFAQLAKAAQIVGLVGCQRRRVGQGELAGGRS